MAAVGLNYQGELRDFIAQHLDLLDYVELVPDIAWTDRGPEATNRYVDDRAIWSMNATVARSST